MNKDDFRKEMIEESQEMIKEKFGLNVPKEKLNEYLNEFIYDRKKGRDKANEMFLAAMEHINQTFENGLKRYTTLEHLAVAFCLASLKYAFIFEKQSGINSIESFRKMINLEMDNGLVVFSKDFEKEKN